MTNLRKILALAIAAVLTVAAASASAHAMKPGLLEMTNKMGGSPELDQAMAQITTVDGSGKWVSSECASLTPMAVPKK